MVGTTMAKQSHVPIRVTEEQSQVIDGLRALAAVYVTLAHYKREFLGPKGLLGIVSTPAATGVLLFFVLSGLCIGLSYRSGSSWSTFFTRRAFRIFPLAWCCMCSIFVYNHLTHDKSPDQSQVLGSLFLIPNTRLGQGAGYLNPPLWSLQTELELYLLFPLMLCARSILSSRLFIMLSLVVTVASFVVWRLTVDHFSYHGPSTSFCYLVIWNLGLTLAYGWKPTIGGRELRAVAALVLGLFLISFGGFLLLLRNLLLDNSLAVWYLVSGIGCWLFVIWALDKVPKWLRSRALVAMGKRSYGLYLLHLPVAHAIHPLFSSSSFAFVVTLIVLIIFVEVSFRLIEQPFISIGKKLIARWD